MPDSPALTVGHGCALCEPDGEVNGKPFLVCTEKCTQEIRGLTLKQPWALAVTHFGKDVENRSWSTRYRGLVAIHAGKALDRDFTGYTAPEAESRRKVLRAEAMLSGRWPAELFMHLGGIVAVARIAGCHYALDAEECTRESLCSPWAQRDAYHWRLEDVCVLPDWVLCKGALGLWRLPGDMERAVRKQLEVPGD